MINITLTDLIDVATLQEIQDGFANLTGMAMRINSTGSRKKHYDPIIRQFT